MVETERDNSWIQTFTGRRFWPLDARPEDVCIEDIAHALSQLCRFTGHVPSFYSVAQHSLLVSQHVWASLALPALLHDAAEAYMGDIARPWKQRLHVYGDDPETVDFWRFGHCEMVLLRTIFDALSVPWPDDNGWAEIKRGDDLLLATEGRDFFNSQNNSWQHVPANGYPVLAATISPWGPRMSEEMFLRRYKELRE